jgi:uncharacterized phage-associated protein
MRELIAATTPRHRGAMGVANNFILRGIRENSPIDALHLNFLCYIAYGACLARFDKRLFDEKIEAFVGCPSPASVYYSSLQFKLSAANRVLYDLDYDDEDSIFYLRHYGTGRKTMLALITRVDGKDTNLLDLVWKLYKKYNGPALFDMFYSNDDAWRKARDADEKYLDDGDIAEHFRYMGFVPKKEVANAGAYADR